MCVYKVKFAILVHLCMGCLLSCWCGWWWQCRSDGGEVCVCAMQYVIPMHMCIGCVLDCWCIWWWCSNCGGAASMEVQYVISYTPVMRCVLGCWYRCWQRDGGSDDAKYMVCVCLCGWLKGKCGGDAGDVCGGGVVSEFVDVVVIGVGGGELWI